MASTLWFQQPLGAAFSGAKLYHYAPGTSTLKNVYGTKADADAQTNPLAQPVVLDSAGWAQVWLDGTYKLILKNSAESITYYTVDNVGDASDVNTLPKGHIAGLVTSYVSAASLSIAAGKCRDAADSADMELGSAATVSTASTGANALDAGTIANSTLYAVFLISDSSGANATAGLLSTSFTTPTPPTGYDKTRLIGAVKTNGSAQLIAWTQVGDYFRFTGDVVTDVSDNTLTTSTFETGTLSAPPSCLAHIYASMTNATGTGTSGILAVRTKDAADSAGSAGEAWSFIQTAGAFDGTGGVGSVLVNASSQIEYAAEESDGTASIDIRTLGFTMLTRRDP